MIHTSIDRIDMQAQNLLQLLDESGKTLETYLDAERSPRRRAQCRGRRPRGRRDAHDVCVAAAGAWAAVVGACTAA